MWFKNCNLLILEKLINFKTKFFNNFSIILLLLWNKVLFKIKNNFFIEKNLEIYIYWYFNDIGTISNSWNIIFFSYIIFYVNFQFIIFY